MEGRKQWSGLPSQRPTDRQVPLEWKEGPLQRLRRLFSKVGDRVSGVRIRAAGNDLGPKSFAEGPRGTTFMPQFKCEK